MCYLVMRFMPENDTLEHPSVWFATRTPEQGKVLDQNTDVLTLKSFGRRTWKF